ncbi:hypothetical protein ARMSODRAFT_974289 [Armillaria solidipes]|uniref:Uncharacterized protein n=1 Tax=Armillaria solidipes TaxID=1076256 RepID=A0A2H3BHM0_9AGAR|nr:hypothetical protein ARMSODRAFT_974289 [Armillaria solidipes]
MKDLSRGRVHSGSSSFQTGSTDVFVSFIQATTRGMRTELVCDVLFKIGFHEPQLDNARGTQKQEAMDLEMSEQSIPLTITTLPFDAGFKTSTYYSIDSLLFLAIDTLHAGTTSDIYALPSCMQRSSTHPYSAWDKACFLISSAHSVVPKCRLSVTIQELDDDGDGDNALEHEDLVSSTLRRLTMDLMDWGEEAWLYNRQLIWCYSFFPEPP